MAGDNLKHIQNELYNIQAEIENLNNTYSIHICKINQSVLKINQEAKYIAENQKTIDEYIMLKKELNQLTQGTELFMTMLADLQAKERELLK